MTAGRVAATLRAEARETNERRLLVLTGSPGATRRVAADALDAADFDPARATYVGSADSGSADGGSAVAESGWERVPANRASDLLGRTREAVVLDCHTECRPNAIGRAVGAVDGGGLLVVLAPPLADWPERRDGFDESLAVPPFTVADVAGNFRRRLVSLLRVHPGVAIVDVDAGEELKSGLTDPAPRRPSALPGVPAADERAFPATIYERCLTDDQVDAVHALERLRERGEAVVVEADRGRGKSSAAGLAAAALAAEGCDVLVTAPEYRNTAEVFARATDALAGMDALADGANDGDETPHRLDAIAGGTVRFARPAEAAELVGAEAGAGAGASVPDAVVVDEAAALPVRVLEAFLDAPAVAFTTTVHGYEGAGRGFSVRFRDRLAASDLNVTDVTMTDPIRYAAGDPVETWAFRALGLDASPAVDSVVESATPDSATYRAVEPADLLADEHLLREVFGLLVAAHYRTEPDDLARLLDAPNVTVRALTFEGHVVSVALLAREGALPADLRSHTYEGGRIRGNMIPDVLTCQLRDEDAGVAVGYRVLRIATHHAVRSRGLGSRLLSSIRTEFAGEVDWLGTGYGATPGLLRFWRANGFATVHLSTTRNEASGEYSAVMLAPTSDDGDDLADRHADWFVERIPGVLSDPLDDIDADVVRETLRSVDATPDLDLSPWEWRLLVGLCGGASIFDTAPRPLRRLTVRYLVDAGGESVTDAADDESVADAADGESVADAADDESVADVADGESVADAATDDAAPRPLTDREERLLVRKALQGESWESVAAALDYPSRAEAMRALGRTVPPLVGRYGDANASAELERFE